mmetsp:Transcript_9462/g.26382  ORF Transcript_9462/g.26382 Transcript_9462/m.26382 type:complete len:212 (+) Transcript_9462:11-646(+)
MVQPVPLRLVFALLGARFRRLLPLHLVTLVPLLVLLLVLLLRRGRVRAVAVLALDAEHPRLWNFFTNQRVVPVSLLARDGVPLQPSLLQQFLLLQALLLREFSGPVLEVFIETDRVRLQLRHTPRRHRRLHLPLLRGPQRGVQLSHGFVVQRHNLRRGQTESLSHVVHLLVLQTELQQDGNLRVGHGRGYLPGEERPGERRHQVGDEVMVH